MKDNKNKWYAKGTIDRIQEPAKINEDPDKKDTTIENKNSENKWGVKATFKHTDGLPAQIDENYSKEHTSTKIDETFQKNLDKLRNSEKNTGKKNDLKKP